MLLCLYCKLLLHICFSSYLTAEYIVLKCSHKSITESKTEMFHIIAMAYLINLL